MIKNSTYLFNGAIHKKEAENLKEEQADKHSGQSKQVRKAHGQKDSKASHNQSLQHACPFGAHTWINSHLANSPGFTEENRAIHQTASHPEQEALQKKRQDGNSAQSIAAIATQKKA
ncbi:hypothetical protein [Brevibacillus gelatini]